MEGTGESDTAAISRASRHFSLWERSLHCVRSSHDFSGTPAGESLLGQIIQDAFGMAHYLDECADSLKAFPNAVDTIEPGNWRRFLDRDAFMSWGFDRLGCSDEPGGGEHAALTRLLLPELRRLLTKAENQVLDAVGECEADKSCPATESQQIHTQASKVMDKTEGTVRAQSKVIREKFHSNATRLLFGFASTHRFSQNAR